MNRAIITRVEPRGPCRVSAHFHIRRKGPEFILVAPEGMKQKERHGAAAFRFCQENHIFGVFIGAAFGSGMVWVPVPDELADDFTRTMRHEIIGPSRERVEWFRWIVPSGTSVTFWPSLP